MSQEKKKFKCTFAECNAEFSKLCRLEIHLRKHTGERPFACVEEGCSKTYTSAAHLRRHEISSHTPHTSASLRCPHEDCKRECSNKYSLKKHIYRAHERVLPYICEVCKKGFSKKHQLHAHKYQHNGEIPFKCDYCNIGFTDITSYKKHKNCHKTYTCVCGEIFHRWSLLLKHRKTCIKKKFTCKTCKKEFICKGNYNMHLNIHNKNREVFKCPMENCERLYYYKKNLQQHIDVYHLKIAQHPKSPRPKPVVDKKNVERRKRKDVGSIKKSSALKLVGLVAPYTAEKDIINGEPVEISLSQSEDSDMEIHVRISEEEQQIEKNIEDVHQEEIAV